MGAHDDIDIFRRNPPGAEIVQKSPIATMPVDPAGPFLTVSTTGINQNGVARRSDQKRMKAEREFECLRRDKTRAEFRRQRRQRLGRRIRNHYPVRIRQPFNIDHTVDGNATDIAAGALMIPDISAHTVTLGVEPRPRKGRILPCLATPADNNDAGETKPQHHDSTWFGDLSFTTLELNGQRRAISRQRAIGV